MPKKMNFDGKLDLSILSSDLTVYDDTTPQQLLEMIQNANIIITKDRFYTLRHLF